MTNLGLRALSPPGLPVRVFWVFQAVFWFGVFLWRGVYNYASGHGVTMAGERILSLMIAAVLAVVLAHLFARTALREGRPLNILMVITLTVFLAGVHILIDRLIYAAANTDKSLSLWLHSGFGNLFYMNGWVFLCWLSLFWGLVQYANTQERERALEIIEKPAPVAPKVEAPTPSNVHFWVKSQKRRVRVNAEDIEVVEAVRDYVELHTSTKSFLMRGKISEVEQQFDPKQFIRVHRSFVINLAHIQALKTGESGSRQVVMMSGREVRVGRTFLPVVRARLDG